MRQRALDYLELTKPRISFFSLLTVAVGYFVGAQGEWSGRTLLATMLGTFLVAAGASGLNQLLERDTDAKMRRTENRPLPAGRLRAGEVLAFGILAGVFGVVMLAFAVNWRAGFIAFGTFASYVFLYTPLKRRTTLNTAVGAVPGALPPVIGWAATGREVGLEAWLFFAIVFLWQFPHFLAIAWIYREDYAQARLKMLSVGDTNARRTGAMMVVYCLALLPVSLLPTMLGFADARYFYGALALGIVYLLFALRFVAEESEARARHLVRASIVYLPAMLALWMIKI